MDQAPHRHPLPLYSWVAALLHAAHQREFCVHRPPISPPRCGSTTSSSPFGLPSPSRTRHGESSSSSLVRALMSWTHPRPSRRGDIGLSSIARQLPSKLPSVDPRPRCGTTPARASLSGSSSSSRSMSSSVDKSKGKNMKVEEQVMAIGS